MSDLDLDSIEARANAATEGPWEAQQNTYRDGYVETYFITGAECSFHALRSESDAADAEFIAYARTDVPALVALVRAKESWIDGAKVDMAALEEAAAKATTWHMEALDDLAACVAERDEVRAEVDRLTDLLADVNDSAGQWRRRYEALRDGVTGLCDGWESGANDYDGGPLVNAEAFASDLRAVVARVRALHVSVEQPESEHYYCEPEECDQAGVGGMETVCDVCERLYPCPTIRALDVRHDPSATTEGERTEAHAVTIQQAVSVERQRDEARAEAQRATAWHMEALDDLARAVCALDTSKAIASERRARVNRLVEAVERERAERLALTALLNAKQAWIDGAKVDLDGYDSARAERDAYLAALGAIASMPSASIAVRDVARHALLNGGNR